MDRTGTGHGEQGGQLLGRQGTWWRDLQREAGDSGWPVRRHLPGAVHSQSLVADVVAGEVSTGVAPSCRTTREFISSAFRERRGSDEEDLRAVGLLDEVRGADDRLHASVEVVDRRGGSCRRTCGRPTGARRSRRSARGAPGPPGTPSSAMDFFSLLVAIAVIHGSPPRPCGMWVAVLPSMVNFRSPMRLLVDQVEAPEREEQMGLDALAERGVGQDQPGVGHVQVALGADDRELAVGRHVVERSGTTVAVWAVVIRSPSTVGRVVVRGSYAAVWLGQAGDVGHLLGRLAWGTARTVAWSERLATVDTRRSVAVSPCCLEVLAQEPDHAADAPRSASMPIWVGQGTGRGPRPTRRTSVRKPSSSTWTSCPEIVVTGMSNLQLSGSSAGIFLPAIDMWAGSGMGRPGRRRCQYIHRNASLPQWLTRVSSSRWNGPMQGTG